VDVFITFFHYLFYGFTRDGGTGLGLNLYSSLLTTNEEIGGGGLLSYPADAIAIECATYESTLGLFSENLCRSIAGVFEGKLTGEWIETDAFSVEKLGQIARENDVLGSAVDGGIALVHEPNVIGGLEG
jgi:hypothetical protein